MIIRDPKLKNLEIARDVDSWALREPTTKILDKKSGKMRQKYKVHGYFVSVESAVKKAKKVLLLKNNKDSILSLDEYLKQSRELKEELKNICL